MPNDIDMEQTFLSLLEQFSNESQPITIEKYRQSCEVVRLNAIGTVQDDVYEILRRPEYNNRDLSPLSAIPKTTALRNVDLFSRTTSNGIGKR